MNENKANNKKIKERFLFIVLAAVFLGLFTFLIYISNFFSYLSNRPDTCMNCHVMGTEYATWSHSSHREVATCNDCHVPQNNLFMTYGFKAIDGLKHSVIFTLKMEPQAIIMGGMGRYAVQQNCKRCHSGLVESTSLGSQKLSHGENGNGRLCWDCHRENPHGKVRSLSSTPMARVPNTQSMIPEWLSNLRKK